jgi:hypothetical protein
MNKELEEALSFDPLAEAERLTGQSYKENDAVGWLGMGIMQEHSKIKEGLLKESDDTCFSNSLHEQIQVIENLGFRLLACEDIPGTGDKWRIFWRPGILLFCDSYSGDSTLNDGKAYFSYKGPRNAMKRCSNGFAGELNGEEVWYGSVDVREGLRHCLESMEASGEFLEEWIDRPFLWLLSYGDTKDEGYDHKVITAKRILTLPDEVIYAISGDAGKSKE